MPNHFSANGSVDRLKVDFRLFDELEECENWDSISGNGRYVVSCNATFRVFFNIEFEGTSTKFVPDDFKIVAPSYLFFTLKGQELSFYLIPLRIFYWLKLNFYTSSKMAENTFLGLLTAFSSKNRANSLLLSLGSDSTGKSYRNQLSLVKCQNPCRTV